MKKSERELIFSTLTLFVFSVIGVFFFLLIYLRSTEFSPERLIEAMGLSFFIILPLGYLLAKHAIAFTAATHNILRKLTKDILHELNIPVATIKGNVHLIKRKTTDEINLQRLERIEKASNSLVELYEELNFILRKEIKEVERETIYLDIFIAERVELFFENKNQCVIELNLESLKVDVNIQGLKHCFDNLLENAIKYGKNGGLIQVTLQEKILKIQDEGEGIEGTEIAKIFNRYYQIDRNSLGKGIGLSLVKGFCDEHKIKISIDSKKGLGTCFNLDFSSVYKP